MHERWIWVELIAFDNSQPDCGVAEYVETTGFVPDAICLLVSSPNFALMHRGMDSEYALAQNICSREGHSHNQDRERQGWTNYQVRDLVDNLHRAGVQVFLSFFAQYRYDRFGPEWASDHTEVLSRPNHVDHFGSINALTRLKDGSWFEDIFADKVMAAIADYGFDGWHGPDGWGPLSGPIFHTEFTDDMIDQFQEATGQRLPDEIWAAGQETMAGRTRRAEYIWRHHRREWIEFWSDRWAGFWRKMMTRLHGAGKKGVVNSAWTRAPWEALYRYGVDYRKMADAGIDAMVLETCAASLALDPRPSTRGAVRSYDMYSMVGLIRAYVPEMQLVYLQTTSDTVEQWDAVRHCPLILEREVFNVSNVYVEQTAGPPRRALDGALTCLGDGMSAEEWRMVNRWTGLAVDAAPVRIVGATLACSGTATQNGIDDFTRRRTWDTHRLLYRMMERGAPVQSFARVDDVHAIDGALLAVNPHLFGADERRRLAKWDGGPLVLVGPDLDSILPEIPGTEIAFSDVESTRPLQCAVRGLAIEVPTDAAGWTLDEVGWPEDDQGLIDKRGYWDHLTARPVSDGFLRACADAIWAAVRRAEGGIGVDDEWRAVTGMFMDLGQDVWRVALKNKESWYVRPRVTLPRAIEHVQVRTAFPTMAVEPDGNAFEVRVPPKGLTVVDATMLSEQK